MMDLEHQFNHLGNVFLDVFEWDLEKGMPHGH